MPREYSNRPTGPRTPEPLSFGAADINLQTPQFRAQTNVDPGVNVFGQLQEIIGAAVGVAKLSLDIDTNRIKNELSYEKALEYEAERKERKEAARIGVEAGVIRQDPATVASKENQDKERARLRAIAQNPDAPDSVRAEAVQAIDRLDTEINQARVEAERSRVDATRAEATSYGSQIDAAVANGNLDFVQSLQASLVLKQKEGRLTEAESAIFDNVNRAVSTIKGNEEQEARREEIRAGKLVEEVLEASIDARVKFAIGDPALLDELGKTSGDISKASYDYIIETMVQENPEFAYLFTKGSEAERKAASRAVLRASAALNTAVANQRATQNRIQYNEKATAELENTAVEEGYERAFTKMAEYPFSAEQASSAVRSIARSYIKSRATEPERLAAAEEVMSFNDPRSAAVADKEMKESAARISNGIEDRRDRSRDDFGIEIGWSRQFNSRDQFRSHVISSFGLDPETYNATSAHPHIANRIESLLSQYDTDSSATRAAAERVARSVAATNKEARSRMNPNDVYESLDIFPLTQNLDELGKLTAFQLEGSVRQATTGFSNNEVPKKFLDFMTENAGDPRTFALQDAFWSVHQGDSPWLAGVISNSPRLMRSRMVGLAVGMERKRGTNTGVINNNVLEMLKNLDARTSAGTSAMDENEKAEFAKVQKERETSFIQTIADSSGVKLNGSLLSVDDLDLSPAQVMSEMEASDRARLTLYMDAASAYPASAGDRNALALLMMQGDGYTLIADADSSGNRKPNLVYNPVVKRGGSEYRVFPDYQTMQSDEWKEYLDSHKDRAAEWISANNEKGLVIGADAVESVQISYSDFDAGFYGGVGISVKLRNEPIPYRIPAEQITVDSRGFEAWKRFENYTNSIGPDTAVPGLEGMEYLNLGAPYFNPQYEVE